GRVRGPAGNLRKKRNPLNVTEKSTLAEAMTPKFKAREFAVERKRKPTFFDGCVFNLRQFYVNLVTNSGESRGSLAYGASIGVTCTWGKCNSSHRPGQMVRHGQRLWLYQTVQQRAGRCAVAPILRAAIGLQARPGRGAHRVRSGATAQRLSGDPRDRIG